MAKITTPDSLYGNSRDILREAERENEILADIAGEEYESPGDIPKGKYVIEKRLLDAAQKKNELLEAIADGGGAGVGANKLAIDYATDVLSLKKGDTPIANSGVTLPAYGLSYDSSTGGLTLTKNGTAISGQTVSIPDYGSPLTASSAAGMTDTTKVYVYTGETSASLTNGHWYYYDGDSWEDGGTYNSQGIDTDTTLLVSGAPADAKATGDAVGELKTQIDDIVEDVRDISYPWIEGYRLQTNVNTVNPNGAAASANYAYIIQPCQKDEKYVVTTSANTTFRGCVLTDTSYNVYRNVGDVLTNAEVVPTKDGYIICNVDNKANTHTLTKPESYTSFKEDVLDFMDDTASELASIEQKVPYVNKYVYDGVYTETQISFPNTGLLDTRYGTVWTGETSYKTTDFVDITGLYGIYRTGTTVRYSLWRYCFYDENQTFLPPGVDDTTDYDIVDFQGKDVTWLDIADAPAGAKYIKISWQASRPYTYWTVVPVSEKTGYNLPQITIDGVKPLKFVGKKIVNFGDSIFGNFRDTNTKTDKSISKMIEEATGATVYNAGLGGGRMGKATYPWSAISMYSIADSIAAGNWETQTDADNFVAEARQSDPTAYSQWQSYFSDTFAMLEEIDFSEIDYITIGYGTNDYANNVALKSTDDTYTNEWDYFEGALEYSIKTILTAYPKIRIIVITPCWRWFNSGDNFSYDSDDEQSKNAYNYILPDYVKACMDICEKYHVSCIDTYYTLGFNPYSYTAYFPVNGIDGYHNTDGTHPKQAGRQLRADRIVGQMESLY